LRGLFTNSSEGLTCAIISVDQPEGSKSFSLLFLPPFETSYFFFSRAKPMHSSAVPCSTFLPCSATPRIANTLRSYASLCHYFTTLYPALPIPIVFALLRNTLQCFAIAIPLLSHAMHCQHIASHTIAIRLRRPSSLRRLPRLWLEACCWQMQLRAYPTPPLENVV